MTKVRSPWLTQKERGLNLDRHSFANMQIRSITNFAEKASRFLKDHKELKLFYDGVAYNINRIVMQDL